MTITLVLPVTTDGDLETINESFTCLAPGERLFRILGLHIRYSALRPSVIPSRCAPSSTWRLPSTTSSGLRAGIPHYVFPTSYGELLRITGGAAAEVGA